MTTLDEDPADLDIDDPVDPEDALVEDLGDELIDEDEATVTEPDEQTVDDDDAAVEAEEVEPTVFVPAVEADDADTDAEALVPPLATRRSRRQHRREVKATARRVRRVVRRVDPWSVFKVASIFSLCLWGMVVVASLLLWRAAVAADVVENVESFVEDLGFDDFQFYPDSMFRNLVVGGGIMVVVSTFFAVLLTILFNLIADLTGGIRVTMIEQDLAVRPRRRERVAAAKAQAAAELAPGEDQPPPEP